MLRILQQQSDAEYCKNMSAMARTTDNDYVKALEAGDEACRSLRQRDERFASIMDWHMIPHPNWLQRLSRWLDYRNFSL